MCRPGRILKKRNLFLRIFPTLSLLLALMDQDRTSISMISNHVNQTLLNIAMQPLKLKMNTWMTMQNVVQYV